MIFSYHIYGSSQDLRIVEAMSLLKESGRQFFVTLVDESPDAQVLLRKKYNQDVFPFFIVYDVVGNEQVLGDFDDLKEHIRDIER